MAIFASWIHGHSATIEMNHFGRNDQEVAGIPWTQFFGLRVGHGVQYHCQDNSSYWFHFAIPTPVLVNDRRARIVQAMVLYSTDLPVTMQAIHVWDGARRIFQRDGLSVGGDHREDLTNDVTSFIIADRPEVLWGVGISVAFYFADAGQVTLHSAGVDFDV